MRILAALILAVSLASAAPAVAQVNSSSPPNCDGEVLVLRHSEIKPGGMDKFLAAVAAQKSWYASHGYPDVIFASRIYVPTTPNFSVTDALTYHYSHYSSPDVSRDAAWDAFVKLFVESSSIKESWTSCVPKEMVPPMK